MRLTIFAVLLIPALLLADDNNKKSDAQANAGSQSSKSGTKSDSKGPLTLPPDAKEVQPYTYKWTDPQGKKWIYRQTPFGLVRLEDKPAAPPVENPTLSRISAVEDGNVVHFERETPLGKQKWTKEKSDLTADERAALERQKQQKSVPAVTEGTKPAGAKTTGAKAEGEEQ
ncbi:MAG TPA: hypothetical protein VKV15_24445 [Bryobacteraceae bacterium]|nr:hypothetical protein [Bryobacteraceae bacterium]